jgi:hypothetical protein
MLARPTLPLLVGIAILLLPLALSVPVGQAAGLCGGSFGCTGTLFFAGVPAGLAAGFAVKRWWDIPDLIAGMWLGGVAYGVVITALGGETDLIQGAENVLFVVPFGSGVFVGFLGLPIFVIVALVRYAARRHGGGGVADRTG